MESIQIFQHGPFEDPHAYVGINRGESTFGLHSAGFFDAGERLALAMLRNEGKVDLNIYPLVYLYRHGAELALKQLARSFGEIFRGDPPSELAGLKGNEKHSLGARWKRVRPNVKSAIDMAGPSMDFPGDVGVNEVDVILTELDSFDPAGVVFRYPESLSGDQHLPDVEYINIRVFHAAMQRMTAAHETWRYRIQEDASEHWHNQMVKPWIEEREKNDREDRQDKWVPRSPALHLGRYRRARPSTNERPRPPAETARCLPGAMSVYTEPMEHGHSQRHGCVLARIENLALPRLFAFNRDSAPQY